MPVPGDDLLPDDLLLPGDFAVSTGMAQEVLDQIVERLRTIDLVTYVEGLAVPFQLVEDWASDTDDGETGWSLLVDVDRCPVEALPWLGQFVGVKVDTSLTEADQRQQIHDLANLRRGTIGALTSAPAPYLTGSKTVIFRERYDTANTLVDSPGHLTVITYTSETPDSAKVLAALLAQKPAGLILHYNVNAGQDFQQLKDNYATFQDVKDAYPTFEGVKSDEPGV